MQKKNHLIGHQGEGEAREAVYSELWTRPDGRCPLINKVGKVVDFTAKIAAGRLLTINAMRNDRRSNKTLALHRFEIDGWRALNDREAKAYGEGMTEKPTVFDGNGNPVGTTKVYPTFLDINSLRKPSGPSMAEQDRIRQQERENAELKERLAAMEAKLAGMQNGNPMATEETEPPKPKRKRRTKAEIDAEKANKEGVPV